MDQDQSNHTMDRNLQNLLKVFFILRIIAQVEIRSIIADPGYDALVQPGSRIRIRDEFLTGSLISNPGSF
jgi:hypothetical protein